MAGMVYVALSAIYKKKITALVIRIAWALYYLTICLTSDATVRLP